MVKERDPTDVDLPTEEKEPQIHLVVAGVRRPGSEDVVDKMAVAQEDTPDLTRNKLPTLKVTAPAKGVVLATVPVKVARLV